MIYGKNVDGELLRIEELNNFEGEAVIRGCVVSYLERNLKQPDKKLVILSVTDFTDTIEVKIFIKLRQLSDISEFIQKGSYLKVKGVVSYDSFSKEKNISKCYWHFKNI